MTNGLSHCHHLDESTFILRGTKSDFEFLTHFSMKFLYANRIAPDGTPRSAASHLGIFYLPMSHKKDTRLTLVKIQLTLCRNDNFHMKNHNFSLTSYLLCTLFDTKLEEPKSLGLHTTMP